MELGSAEKSFLQGLSLGTQVSSSRRYGLFLTAMGRFDEASHHLGTSQNIDPFSNRQKIAWKKFLYLTGRYEEGVVGAIDLRPDPDGSPIFTWP